MGLFVFIEFVCVPRLEQWSIVCIMYNRFIVVSVLIDT